MKEAGQTVMVTKGALQNILDICQFVDTGGAAPIALADHLATILQTFQELSTTGLLINHESGLPGVSMKRK